MRGLDRDAVSPIAGATLYDYHSDASGAYVRDGAPASEPRLCGILRADSLGRYRIRTCCRDTPRARPTCRWDIVVR